MSSSAARKRLLCRRMREGKIVVAVELDIDDLGTLADAGVLNRTV